jgi:ribulose-5-phosphate 4-epimerase/fuculose-1-phosphate aldolase
MVSTAFTGKLAYHDYEGPSLDLDERGRLLDNLGEAQAMMLRNHGLLTTGRTVPEAFLRLYRLERACQVQLDAAAAGTLNVMGNNLAAKSGADMDRFSEMESEVGVGDLEFAALIRKLDKTDASWRH